MSEHPLPDLTGRWVQELLGGNPAPAEPGATCDDCAMCVKASGEAPTSVYFFDPQVKCCVYMPRLPNFLVGAALKEPDSPGRRTVEARLNAGAGVTPLGLERPPSYDLLFRNSVNAIGRSRTLRCPHYLEETGTCGIYRQRDATCSTWFCRHERGALGGDFWRALRQLLSVVERELSRWCLLELDLDVEALAALLGRSPDEDHVPPPPPEGAALDGAQAPLHRLAWGPWAGREAELYIACAEHVEALGWDDLLALAGPELALRAKLVQRRWAALQETELPERLKAGGFQVVGTRPGGVRAATYSSLDALDLPSQFLAVLPLFDGRPTAQVLDQLQGSGIAFDPGFLRQLVDWKVLVEPGRG